MVMGGKFASREGPAWLPALVRCEEFFSHCESHTVGKSERNQFCFDCPDAGPLCPEQLAVAHGGHASVQVRRASHRDVVRVADVQRFVDLANIQLYTINSARIVFLQSKPQARIVKGAAHYCEGCQRSIADPVRFCSILCKLQGILDDPHDFTLTLTVCSPLAASPATSHGSGTSDFAPHTPRKRAPNSTHSPLSKKPKSADPVLNLSVRLSRDDDTGLSPLSPMAPLTPTFESGPKVHHRKQVRPHRAPMF
jgi:hypothetical protein